MWIASWLDTTSQDVRYALRNLFRAPAFTVLVLITLCVGIAVNTSLLTVFSALFLRPWPVPDPSSLFELSIILDNSARFRMQEFSLNEYRHLRDQTRSLSGLMASDCADDRAAGCRVKLDGQTVGALFVSDNYFEVLGIPMERGTGFDGSQQEGDAVAVISYDLWQRHFGSDGSIIGRAIRCNDAELTVVGVASRGFSGTSFGRKELWLPFGARRIVHPYAPAITSVRIAGRLGPGISPAQAAAELESLSRAYRSGFAAPESRGDMFLQVGRIALTATSFNPNPGKSQGAFVIFALLAFGTLLILILACANVGNLLLARNAARSRELAVRVSLGAGRMRLLRQLLTESLILAIVAATLGSAMAYVIPPMFLQWIYTQFGALGTPRFSIAPDGWVLAWTLVLVITTCVSFGLAPAVHAVRESVVAGLKGNAGGGGSRLRLRSVLLAVQVVVSVVLLAGAALLVRSVGHAATVDLGFVADDVVFLEFDVPASYDAHARAVFARQLLDATTDLAETKAVALATTIPFGQQLAQIAFRIAGDTDGRQRLADALEVSSGYFEILGIPIVGGRLFEPADRGRDVVVVDESLAASLWPGQTPLGRVLLIEDRPAEIVGLVKDADTSARQLRGTRGSRVYIVSVRGEYVAGTIYRQLRGSTLPAGNLPQVLAQSASAAPAAIIKRINGVDARVDVQVRRLKDSIDRQLGPSRMGALVAAILAVVALTFASIGVFGVFAYIVQQRTREIGVRMALGAQQWQVIRFIVQSSSWSLLAGLCLGLAAAIAASRMIQSSLIGISALDRVAYVAVLAILACAAVVAVLVPSSRATRVDPVAALRCE